MTTKTFCDRCGDDDAGRVVFSGSTSKPGYSSVVGPNFDADLCHRCTVRAAKFFQEAYTNAMTKEGTPPS